MGATEGEDLVDAGDRAGREHGLVRLAASRCRGGDDDAFDAGDPRRDRAHEDSRRVRRAAARHVDAGGADGDLGNGDALPLAGFGHCCLATDLGAGDGLDVRRRSA